LSSGISPSPPFDEPAIGLAQIAAEIFEIVRDLLEAAADDKFLDQRLRNP